ncbi:7-cyano-7-deazaguanine synthase [Pseudoalteromonas arctica]|uniref:asparagine synthetase B family protein n=1 Tax=Pseudoalteromonas arctica TaxID=394751 RepID=UPI001C9CDFB9|nr:asparagine synthase-related protein [Pseudoalteromonas arctica]MBZ2192805.1 7-cyano-7-deazaguanine synthase [Pseudoalteromonas arctica]
MCGIALLCGENAKEHMPSMLSKLSHRGPDDLNIWLNSRLALGFVRLAINDESIEGRVPHQVEDWVSAFNGEIYNAEQLIRQYNLFLNSKNDTHVIAPLFSILGNQILTELDGFYAGILYQSKTNSLYLLRDYIGKKPLFYGRSEGRVFVVSELKVLKEIDWFEQVPLGISKLDLLTGKLIQVTSHPQITDNKSSLEATIERAVLKRLPAQPIGVFLSGGLDSSIVAALAHKHHQDVIYFVLGNADSPDVKMAERVIEHLGLQQVKYVSLPTISELPSLIAKVIKATESFNPSIISNGLATYLLAEAAHKENLKVVLTGEGADELFSGYHALLPEVEWLPMRERLINDMHFTELRRLDTCSMAHSIEARCPFLDRSVKSIADSIEYNNIYSNGQNKAILRDAFKHKLPIEITERKKTSFDVGSGIRKLVVQFLTRNGCKEIDELKVMWKQIFLFNAENGYFYRYPAFDDAIAKRTQVHR